MKARLKELVHDCEGSSAVEYGIILAMIVLAMFASLKGVSNESVKMWGNISSKSNDAVQAANAG